jgi:transcriptional regulator with XRE-family HTH domain
MQGADVSSLGRFIEQRRTELGLSRRELAERAELSYPYVSQLETGERQPALKAMQSLAPALEVRVEELASMVAGGDWTGGSVDAFAMPTASRAMASPGRSAEARSPRTREKTLLSLERRLRDVPPLDRIALLNELIAQALAELGEAHTTR